jgi:hypothetical protein
VSDLLEIPVGTATAGSGVGSTVPPAPPSPEPAITLPPEPIVPPTPQAVAPVLPTPEEMEQELVASGKLLADVPLNQGNQLDTSVLSALQPGNMVNTGSGPQPLSLPSEHAKPLPELKLATTHVATPLKDSWMNAMYKPTKMGLAFLLTAQGLFGIYKNVSFILVDYPKLEKQLLNQEITQFQVNSISTQAIIIAVVTLLQMVSALHIIRGVKKVNIAIGLTLFLFGTYINSALSTEYDSISLLSQPFVSFAEWITRLAGAIMPGQ